MTNEEYIFSHRNEDTKRLALGAVPPGVDIRWALRQIEGWQLACKKLPEWSKAEGLWYPPRLSMEQCSSEATALYKTSLAERLLYGNSGNSDNHYGNSDNNSGSATGKGGGEPTGTLIDLTGGFGVDFSYMSRRFRKALYVEQQEELCRVALHNFSVLGLGQADVTCCTAEDFLDTIDVIDAANKPCDVLFLDPARRDGAGRKTVAISDCTPNVVSLQGKLLQVADSVIVKLSPMLDIKQALRQLKNVTELHVVSYKGECKELLFVMKSGAKEGTCSVHCVNLGTSEAEFVCECHEDGSAKANGQMDYMTDAPSAGLYLFEPNASIQKAGLQDGFAAKWGLRKLHPMSHLFVGSKPLPHVPARQFVITATSDFSKAGLKSFLKDIKQANLTVRNFPESVDKLRRRLKIKEGGSTFLFATTLFDGSHILISAIQPDRSQAPL